MRLGKRVCAPGKCLRICDEEMERLLYNKRKNEEDMAKVEISILLWIQENLRCAFTDWFFPAVTFLGNKGLIWIAAAVALLFFKQYRKWGVLLLAALLITTLVGEAALKNLIGRPRPCTLFPEMELLIPRPGSYSFPSGHSASSFAAAAVLLKCRRAFGIPAILLAALIAFSRLFLFVHYPTDVLAGAALGAILGLLVCWAGEKLFSQRQRKREA